MTLPPLFLLDSNVFIEAANRYYAFDIAPAFWQQLLHHAHNGRLLSIDRVKNELARQQDDLSQWANGQFHSYFASTADQEIMRAYADTIQWAYSQAQFTPAAKEEFAQADNADAWLVAYAKAKGCVVVTHEQYDPNIRRRIPIPNVCRAFGVPYVDTFTMLRQLEVSFR
jgi:hypothetical protein